LDFFVNDDKEYAEQLKIIFSKLQEDGFFWDTTSEFISAQAFTTLKIRWDKSETALKLDFVNDVASHFGEIIKTELFVRTDSIRNMFSNKLTALFRFSGKDVADIREIALHETINWKQAIQDAQQKEMGIDAPTICDILTGMPQQEFETVNWTKKPEWQEFRSDIDNIVLELISGQPGIQLE
jgi:hypothetical protein